MGEFAARKLEGQSMANAFAFFEYCGTENRIDGGTEFTIGNRLLALRPIQHS